METSEFLLETINAMKSFAEHKDIFKKKKIKLAKIIDHNPKILERIRTFLCEWHKVFAKNPLKPSIWMLVF